MLIELPRVIEEPYPYLVLGDLPEVGKRFLGEGAEPILRLQKRVFDILNRARPEATTYIQVLTEKMNESLTQIIIEEMEKLDGNLGVIQMDRYIGQEINADNLFRMNVSRGVDGGLMPRPGTTILPEEQVTNLAEWAKKGNYKKLLFVDDVLAFGDTLTPLIQMTKELLPDADIEVLVGVASSGGGWNGKERVEEATGVKVSALCISKAGEKNDWTSGMAIPTSRDFTLFGGKVLYNENLEIGYSFPYFLPFSIPVISFMEPEKRVAISVDLMEASIKAVMEIENQYETTLTLGDLSKAGFGIPVSCLKCLKDDVIEPNPEMKVTDYLGYYQALLEERMPDVCAEVMQKESSKSPIETSDDPVL